MYAVSFPPKISKLIEDNEKKAFESLEWNYKKQIENIRKFSPNDDAALIVFSLASCEALLTLIKTKSDSVTYNNLMKILSTNIATKVEG